MACIEMYTLWGNHLVWDPNKTVIGSPKQIRDDLVYYHEQMYQWCLLHGLQW